MEKYLVIGAGPSGLAAARNLQKHNIPFEAVETYSDVGGLWNIKNPRSTVYNSAHLISSKKMTEFLEFPMDEKVADYPSHSEMCKYFQDFAHHFKLKEKYRFNLSVVQLTPNKDKKTWEVTFSDNSTQTYKGVIIANGTLSEPNIPKFKGDFSGEFIHSSQYKSAKVFADKKVLIVGAGNSGCDIAVDAIHHAAKVDMSVRRGYHFVPKYIMGVPADAIGGKIKLPGFLKQQVDKNILKIFTGDPVRFGFPKPDHELYESHPIVNSLILHYLGHGDISIKADIDSFHGKKVHFKDGTSEEYDLVLLATGYILHYPFIDKKLLNWKGSAPDLYLNIFSRKFDNLFIVGMIEAAGIGWQGRYEQAALVANYILAKNNKSESARIFDEKKLNDQLDLKGGMKYLKLDRMAYYVHKDTYKKVLAEHIEELR